MEPESCPLKPETPSYSELKTVYTVLIVFPSNYLDATGTVLLALSRGG